MDRFLYVIKNIENNKYVKIHEDNSYTEVDRVEDATVGYGPAFGLHRLINMIQVLDLPYSTYQVKGRVEKVQD